MFLCVYRRMNTLGKFGEHSGSQICSRFRLEQLLRFSFALQTSRVYPNLDTRALSMNQLLKMVLLVVP